MGELGLNSPINFFMMKPIIRIFIAELFWLSACQSISQVATPITPKIDTQYAPTITPTVLVTATTTLTATAIPTTTPLYYSTPILLPSESISTENIQDLHELASFGKGKANSFSYSTNGKLLSVATMRGIYIYDTHTFVEQKYIPTDDSVNYVAFSPDGTMLASTFSRGSVRLWQVSNGALLKTFENNAGYTGGSLLFSPDGFLLFSGSGDGAIREWQIADGKLIHTFRGSRAYSANEMINSMSISLDGSLLATTDGFKRIWIWRVSTGELVQRLEGNRVVFSTDGKILAVSKGYYSDDLSIDLWQSSDWTLMTTWNSPHNGHQGRILSMSFSPDGETILINDIWRQAKLWDISNQKVSMCFQCGQKNFDVLLFSPDGETVTTLDWDGVLQVWNMSTGDLVYSFDEHMETIPSLAFSVDGKFLAASGPSSVNLWRIADSALLNFTTFKSYNSAFPQKMAFSPDNKYLAFGPEGGGLRLREIDHPNPFLVLNDGKTVSAMAFSSKGTILAVGFETQTIEFRQMPDGALVSTLELDRFGGTSALAYSPDDEFLAVCGYEDVEIWRLSDKTLLHRFRRNGSMMDQMMFSPNGMISITGQTTAQYSGLDGKQLQSLYLRGVTFSPDTKLVVDIQGNKLNFFRMDDGKLIRTLRLSYYAQDVVFSPNGKLIAVAGNDGTIRIWGVP